MNTAEAISGYLREQFALLATSMEDDQEWAAVDFFDLTLTFEPDRLDKDETVRTMRNLVDSLSPQLICERPDPPFKGLRYSERKLWRETPDDDVLEILRRLARQRNENWQNEPGLIAGDDGQP